VPGLIRRLWRIAAGVLAGLVILLAVAIGLVRLALVQVPEYADQIESWASAALGWPVEVGTVDARWGWHGPELRFTDARVLTQDRERTLVKSAAGSMQVDSWSLLRGRPMPGAVSFSGVSLRIERTHDGRWRLLGEEGPALPERGGSPGDGLPRLRELPTGDLRLADVTLEVEDLRKGRGPWVFQVDRLELRLGNGELSVSVSGALPRELGDRLALSAVVSGQDDRGRPRDWTAGVSFSALDLPAIGAALGHPEWLPALGMLDGSFSAASLDGRLARVAGEVIARDLLPLAAGAAEAPEPADGPVLRSPAMPLERLAATLEWTRRASGWDLKLDDLDVERNGRRWLSPKVAVIFEAAGAVRRVEARADRLELDDLALAAPWLPAQSRALVRELAPAGTVRELELHLDLPDEEGVRPEIYLAAGLEAVSVAPRGRWPGVRNVSGRIAGDLFGGTATIDSAASAFDLPWMFREPLILSAMQASVEWSRDDHGFELRVPALELANDDASIGASGRLQIPAGDDSPFLEIEAVARDVRVSAAPRYLPVNRLNEKVVEWLDAALVSGRVDEARLVLRGATREFPFREGDGLFKVEFDLEEAVLDFDPGWPDATAVKAGVRFENEGLWAEVREARLLDVEAGPASVSIPDFRDKLLLIEGGAKGRLGAFREFVLNADLLERILGAGLEPASMPAGQVAADLRLRIPLDAIAQSRAEVELQISNATVAYGFLGEPLHDIEARLSIDNAQVTGRDVTATLAGSPLVADVVMTDTGAVRVEGRGRMDAAGLSRVLELPLENWVSGAGDWSGHLQFPAPDDDAPLEFAISSSLVGLAIGLPEPLRKGADEARGLNVRAAFPDAALVEGELEWDDSLRIAARIDRSGERFAFRPVPGAVAGEPPGLVFSGAVKRLDLGEWFRVEWPPGIEAEGIPGAVAGGRLLVGELSAPALDLRDALLELSRVSTGWRLGVAAARAAGEIEIPFSLYGDVPVTARLERLWLGSAESRDESDDNGQGEASPAADAPAVRIAPSLVPPLDLEIDDLRHGAVRLGRLSARVLHEGDGFELIGLESVGDGFIIQAEGRSRLSETVDASHLGVKIQSEDVGATLEYMGFRRGMEASNGRFESRMEWQGGLRSDWLAAMKGTASIAIGEGRLVGVEPGAGRVFGLLSIQALPRRLALDFKDVFGEGTSFDRIAGDFDFIEGSAYTDNLLMEGPSANMIVVGRTGLIARDYDQTVVIGADLGRTLPVAGAVVGGPAVGAALYLLSEIFRKPFQAQITYRLTGTIENPVIERVPAGTIIPAQPPSPEPPQGGD
jgi:uncharacterized protein (TIGR02099 family)